MWWRRTNTFSLWYVDTLRDHASQEGMTRPLGSGRKGPARADIAQVVDDAERVKRAMIFWDFRNLGFRIFVSSGAFRWFGRRLVLVLCQSGSIRCYFISLTCEGASEPSSVILFSLAEPPYHHHHHHHHHTRTYRFREAAPHSTPSYIYLLPLYFCVALDWY